MRGLRISAEQQQQLRETWSRYADEELPKLGRRHGEIVVPLKKETLASGYVLFSLACEEKLEGKNYFGLFFLSMSPQGRLAQFAVEGVGEAKLVFPRYREFMASGKWKQEP